MEEIKLDSSDSSIMKNSIAEIREGFPQSYSISNKKINSVIDQYLADYELYLFLYLSDIWNSLYEGKNLSEKNKIEFFNLNYQNHKMIIDAQITAMLSIYHILKNKKIKFDVWMEIFDEMAHYSFRAVWSSNEVFFDQVLNRFNVMNAMNAVKEYKKKVKRNEVKNADPEKYKKYIFASQLLNYLRDHQSENFNERKNWYEIVCQIARLKDPSNNFRNWYNGKVRENDEEFMGDVEIKSNDDLIGLHKHWVKYFKDFLPNRILKPLKLNE